MAHNRASYEEEGDLDGLPTYEQVSAQTVAAQQAMASFQALPAPSTRAVSQASRNDPIKKKAPPVPPKRISAPSRSMSLPSGPVRESTGMRRRSSSNAEEYATSSQLMPKYAILLLGMTGAGKSSFIASATGLPVEVGHTLDPCTREPQSFDMVCRNGIAVSLIDTPGFNDLRRVDMDILQSLNSFLTQISTKQRIIAVFYLHRIVDKKITGSSEINLRILRAICGEHFYQSVALITSMWRSIASDGLSAASEREEELNSDDGGFWGDMCRMGARYQRWDDVRGQHFAPARAIVEEWVNAYTYRPNTAKLQILLELEKGTPTEETSAGRILTEELRKRQEKERRRLEAEEEERRLLEEEATALQDRYRRAQDGIRKEAELAGSRYRRNDHPLGRLHDLLPEILVGRNRISAPETQYDARAGRERDSPRRSSRSDSIDDVDAENSRSHRTQRHPRRRTGTRQYYSYFVR